MYKAMKKKKAELHQVILRYEKQHPLYLIENVNGKESLCMQVHAINHFEWHEVISTYTHPYHRNIILCFVNCDAVRISPVAD